MKKVIFGSLLCGVLLIAGCESEKHHIDSQVVKAEPDVQVYDVSYDLKVSSDANKVTVLIKIDNGDYSPIPLLTSDGKLFSVKLKEQDGTVIAEKFIEQKGRTQILRNENVDWEVEFEVNRDEKVIVETDILLKSGEYQKFKIHKDVQREPIIVSTNKLEVSRVSFAPEKDMIYTYKVGKDKEYKEEFMIYSGNKVQSFSEETGVKIYAEETDGMYYFSSPDPVGDIDGTEFVKKESMDLIIPFPIVEGTTWKIGDKEYKLTDENLKVKTELGIFDDSIEITEINRKEKRYYYYQKDVGLLKVKFARNGNDSKTELQLVKMELPEDILNKNEEEKK